MLFINCISWQQCVAKHLSLIMCADLEVSRIQKLSQCRYVISYIFLLIVLHINSTVAKLVRYQIYLVASQLSLSKSSSDEIIVVTDCKIVLSNAYIGSFILDNLCQHVVRECTQDLGGLHSSEMKYEVYNNIVCVVQIQDQPRMIKFTSHSLLFPLGIKLNS